MRILYFDCFAGASGNMILGALIGLGVDREALAREIAKLDLPGASIEVTDVDRSGISASHVEVRGTDEKRHRHLADIVKIIRDSSLDESVKNQAIAIFTRLADAEAKVHGIGVEKVHFHEVGAVDAIVDVVGACIGFKLLGIEQFVCSKINVGSGFVDMDHGRFPVPPPAVTELLRDAPIYSNEIDGELITPTGAAIISTVASVYGAMPEMQLEATAYGAGTRSYERFPNVLRLMLGETQPMEALAALTDNLVLIETNLDDISPQVLGFVMERAFELGAFDCWFTSIQMKKNRPATMVSILCTAKDRAPLSELLYTETTTLGLRVRRVERECLIREVVNVRTRFGDIDVKVARFNGRISNAMPEYEQVRQLALKNGVPFLTVQQEALAQLERDSRASAA